MTAQMARMLHSAQVREKLSAPGQRLAGGPARVAGPAFGRSIAGGSNEWGEAICRLPQPAR